MDGLRIFLFGKFRVCRGDQPLAGLDARKVQELFCYLLVYRNRPHPREKLANLMWGNSTQSQSKQYLRQTLWQLQSVFENREQSGDNLFVLESEWIQINPAANVWLDVSEFERVYSLTRGKRGRELDEETANELLKATQLYQGEFLENCYQDWCIVERERFQNMHYVLLDKLMEFCEVCQEYERGIEYGTNILRFDIAQERTHRRLMRLYYLAGDRTSALRQYERCLFALEQELGAKPTSRTDELYTLIKQDQLHADSDIRGDPKMKQKPIAVLSEILLQLMQLRTTLFNAHHQIEQDIDYVRTILEK